MIFVVSMMILQYTILSNVKNAVVVPIVKNDTIQDLAVFIVLEQKPESNLKEDHVEIRIEPVLVKNDSIYASVLYERNYIAFCGAEQEKIELLGLGAGRYPTSTAIVSDIIQITNLDEKLDLVVDNELKIDNSALTDKYLIDGEINKDLIGRKVGKFFETKMIERKEIEDNLDKIKFYARIK